MTQLIDQPTNIEPSGISCVDLIVIDQPNLLIDHGIHSSLDNCCHHQIIYGKSVPLPPPYKRQACDYSEARADEIQSSLRTSDWTSIIVDLRERSLSTERRGAEDFVKNRGKISDPNILASENPIPQQKSRHKFHTPTKSTPVSLRQ